MIKENNHRIGKTGEKYIIFDKISRKYVIWISVGEKKQLYVGRFSTLHEAITARDKYLTEML